jgi:hypothetical protein
MARGGSRPGAGRPKGAATRRTREIADAALEEGLTPLEYLLNVMRNPGLDEARRIDAAKAAAPYVHPRLATVEVGNKDDKPFEQVMRWASSPNEATPDPSRL